MKWANILNPLNHFIIETYAKIPGIGSVIINRVLQIFSIAMLSLYVKILLNVENLEIMTLHSESKSLNEYFELLNVKIQLIFPE